MTGPCAWLTTAWMTLAVPGTSRPFALCLRREVRTASAVSGGLPRG
jgi:hypothetical protein